MGAARPFCFVVGADCTHFSFFGGDRMRRKTRLLTHGAVLAALYVAMTYLQNLLLPGSASWVIQFRASEALCVLSLFTPAAIGGLSVGCLLFDLSFAAALPLDWLMGTLASLLGTWLMWLTRRWTVRGFPLPALLMPALTNALLVGWELSLYVGGTFWLNALYIALGEAAVLLSLGTLLFLALKRRRLDVRLFGDRNG